MDKKNKKLNSAKKSLLLFCLYAFSGVAFALPFIFPSLWLLGWLAPFGVFFLELFREHKKQSYFRSYLRGFCFFWFFGFVVFSWFFELYPLDFLDFDKAGAIAVIAAASIGLPFIQAIFSAFLFVFTDLLRRRDFTSRHPILTSLFFACFYCVCEFIHTLTWVGVPWGRLGVGQVGCIFNIQSASLFGSYFISFLMILTAALFAFALKSFLDHKPKKTAVFASIALLVFFSNFIFGVVRVHISDNTDRDSFTACAVQGNIKYEKKRDVEHTLKTYKELSKKAADEGADLIVWPETAIPFDTSESPLIEYYFSDVAKECSAELIATAFMSEEDKLYNISRLVYPDGTIDDPIYAKRRLVPFGEFLPMKDFIKTVYPPLATLAEIEDPLTAGTDTAVFSSQRGKIASLICFDSIYEGLTLDSVRDGAELLVISTNDSWFMGSPALMQHNAHAALRAVESNRYIVRSANTGISSVISPTGEVLSSVGEGAEGYALSDIAMISDNTLYTSIGNLIIILCAAFGAIVVAFAFFNAGRKQNDNSNN